MSAPEFPSVVTRSERGRRGYLGQQAALEREHGAAGARRIRREWQRRGGRKPNSYYDAISLGQPVPALTARTGARKSR